MALLANPRAGRGRGARLAGPVREALAAAGLDVLVLAGESGRESIELAADAVAQGVAAVVAVGGDGLVHCAVQALAGTEVPLGIVPAGGGNDLAGVLGLPADPAAAVAVIAAGRTRRIDLGRTDRDSWFAGVLNAGFDSAVVARAERMRRPRGPLRYDVAAWLEMIRLRPYPMRITLDGETSERDVTLVAVGNSTRYGGGMLITPGAELDDGIFDVTVAAAMTRRHLAGLKPLVRTGRHVLDAQVSVYRAREVTLESPALTAYADGEAVGPLPVTATCVPAALTVLVPEQVRTFGG
jgi:diacylglycerol kinase (ATP)